jgi:hypothetical protein
MVEKWRPVRELNPCFRRERMVTGLPLTSAYTCIRNNIRMLVRSRLRLLRCVHPHILGKSWGSF